MEKWDILVLTAGSEKQKEDFELMLSNENLTPYCKKTVVIADYTVGVRIGSGGATLNVLNTLGKLEDKKILLVHSGGLSQRMPHLSALGKIFATLPDGSTILEKKLASYKHLPGILPPGLLVSASDVAEDVTEFGRCGSCEMIVSATESRTEEAEGGGVLVLDPEGKLKTVLQKPSLELIKDSGAVLPSGNALTYCIRFMEKWDILILTAGSEKQKQDFELILSKENLTSYCKKTLVVADFPVGVRIGSGGATLNVLNTLGELSNQKILLIHSGGLSQRTPHLSALGKIFATLPDGSTILEKKLHTYKHLPSILPPGLLVAASDVVEDVSRFQKCKSSEMIVFATESSLEVAKDHGVFVLDSEGKLKTVLQKPSLELIKNSGAVLPSGNALTDCFYWLSWTICKDLIALWHDRGPCKVETCCYGDFMRPLGYAPLLDYLNEGSSELSLWRKSFAKIFSKITPQVVNLGTDSFFHMGTPRELMVKAHCYRESTFAQKFLPSFSQDVYCSLDNCTIGSGSLIEYCKLKDASIGDECIISGCESTKTIQIPNKSMMFTLCIKDNGKRSYTTVLLRTDDDMKAKKEKLFWMERETTETNVSLWEAKLFPIERSREDSFQATLKLPEGVEFRGQKISIAEAVAKSDLEEMITFRQSLKHQLPSSSCP